MKLTKKNISSIIICLLIVVAVVCTTVIMRSRGNSDENLNNAVSDFQSSFDSLSDSMASLEEETEEYEDETDATVLSNGKKVIDENSVYYGKEYKDLLIHYETDNEAVKLLNHISFVEYFSAGSSLKMLGTCVSFIELAKTDKAQWTEIPAYLDSLTPVQLDFLSLRVVESFSGALSIVNEEEYIMQQLTESLAGIPAETYKNCSETQVIRLLSYLFNLFEERGVKYEWETYDVMVFF